jgi:cytoskeletal protein RodZ
VLSIGGLAVANFSSQQGKQSSSDSAGASAPEAESGADSKAESKTGSESGSESGSDSGTGATQLPDLSAASFESDVSILLQGRASMLASEGEAAGKGDAADQPAPNSRDNALAGAPGVLPSRACPGPEVTDGANARQVLYDGRKAVLLVHPERGGRLLVEAWNCDGDRRLASTKIKA